MTNYELALLISAAAICLGAVALVVRIRARREDATTAPLQERFHQHAGKDDKSVRDPHLPDSNAPTDYDRETGTHTYDFFA
jgi:hypothetical protein